MGNTTSRRHAEVFLPSPATDKEEFYLDNTHFRVGVASMQGWRRAMEDAFVVSSGNNGELFVGVFDGHGTSLVAQHCASRVVDHFHHHLALDESSLDALRNTFFSLDDELLTGEDTRVFGGSTAICAWLDPRSGTVTVANAGDSRGVLFALDGKIIPLSEDHKPKIAKEKLRIEHAGGFLSRNGRVNGILALSRALGDFALKLNPMLSAENQIVTCAPDVNVFEVRAGDILVLACDGVFDVSRNEDIWRVIQGERQDLSRLCRVVLDRCLAKKSMDNMTVVVVEVK